jgi:hypothetical protein
MRFDNMVTFRNPRRSCRRLSAEHSLPLRRYDPPNGCNRAARSEQAVSPTVIDLLVEERGQTAWLGT